MDGDNLLKTFCDALKEVAYRDDSQIVHHEVSFHKRNSNFRITGVPLTLQIADLLANKETFTIVRLRQVAEKTNSEEISN